MKKLNVHTLAWALPGHIARAGFGQDTVIDRWLPRAMIWLTFAVIAFNRR